MIALSSCQEEIVLELPDESPVLIINGRIGDTLGSQVQVFTSAPYYSTEIPAVSEASVILFENGIRVDSLVEVDTANGYYVGNFNGSVGNVYHIEVSIRDSNDAYQAGTWVSMPETLKRCPPIDSLYSRYQERQPLQPEGYYLFADFREPQGVGDFYRVRVWRNDSLQNDPIDIQNLSDELFDGVNFSGNFALNIDGPKPVGTTYKLELSSITENHSNFIALLQQQTAQVGFIFDAPPALIIGNMHEKGNPDNYVLGYFNASRLRYAEAEIVE